MPYIVRDGRARCAICFAPIGNGWREKAKHDRWHVEQIERREK